MRTLMRVALLVPRIAGPFHYLCKGGKESVIAINPNFVFWWFAWALLHLPADLPELAAEALNGPPARAVEFVQTR